MNMSTGPFFTGISSLLMVVGLALSMAVVSSGRGLTLGSELAVVRGVLMRPDVLPDDGVCTSKHVVSQPALWHPRLKERN
uniref:Secreted protein n=1 Tax=Timema monikensis TaxID=170555 RepID=A0A7R9ELG0_9NEOP|nr:unnamed protein product [Timema monikensis]